MDKKKIYDILVVGSGLSSLTFVDSYLKRNKKIDIISFENKKIDTSNFGNNHIFKILPPQMIGQKKRVNDYFFFNNIKINKNCNFFGSLEFGGLSNYWGLQIDKNIMPDILHLSKKTQNKINHCFRETINEYNLLDKISTKRDSVLKKNKYFDEDFAKINNHLILEEPILAYQKKVKKYLDLKSLNEAKDKFVPLNFLKYIKNKKIIFHNYYVKEIKKQKNYLILNCSDDLKNKNFITKKLVLGCGTLITTKLIMNYLKIKNEVRINHHPRLFSLYFSKKKWKSHMSFEPSQVHLKLRKNPFLFTADFRPGNKIIINAIIRFKVILKPIKFLIDIFREYMIFSNIFLESKYGNLFIKKNNKFFEIFSKQKNLKKIFKKTSGIVYQSLSKSKKIFPFYHNYFPGFGADFHYFGTIPMNNRNKLSVNEKCQLRNNKNIYIIDGSIFNFKKNKYPLGLIIANSRRVGKEI